MADETTIETAIRLLDEQAESICREQIAGEIEELDYVVEELKDWALGDRGSSSAHDREVVVTDLFDAGAKAVANLRLLHQTGRPIVGQL